MKNQMFYRSFEIDEREVNEKDRSVKTSFSSEMPAKRWFGNEILLHGKKNVDLSRLKNHGAALLNHNPSVIVGPLKNISIKDRVGFATVIFDQDEDGEKAFGKVKSGSLRGVSVGYTVQKFREVLQNEDYETEDNVKIKGPAMVAIRWTPHEISLTPIPLDSSVGIGRELTRSLDGIDIERTIKKQEAQKMEKHEVQEMIDGAIGRLNFAKPEDIPKAEDIATAVRSILTEDARPKMRVDTETFTDLLGRAGAVSPECKNKISDMAVDGKTEPEMLRAITDMATGKSDAEDLGDLGDGLKKKKKGTMDRTLRTSFEGLDDKDFFSGIVQPTMSFN